MEELSRQLRIKAHSLAMYFDWEIPSEQYREVLKTLTESARMGMLSAAEIATNLQFQYKDEETHKSLGILQAGKVVGGNIRKAAEELNE